MASTPYRISSSAGATMPRPPSDPTRRRLIYGRVQPMEKDRGLLQRLFARH